MTPLRATAALLAAALAIWLLLELGGVGGEAESDPYAIPEAPEPLAGAGMDTEPSLEGSAEVLPPVEPELEHDFRFIVRHAGDERLLEGVRLDDPETGYLGTSNDRGELELSRPIERFAFEATARGYLLSRGTARGALRDNDRGVPETVVFMTPGAPVRGVVLDRETRAAVPDAAIRTWDDDAGRFVTSTIASDANGRFELLGVRLNHPFTLLVQVEGMVPTTSRHQVFDEQEDLEVLVGGAGFLQGVVRGFNAMPDEGIPVFLVYPNRRVPGDERPHDPWVGRPTQTKEDLERHAWSTYRTVTDQEGRYEIKGVPLDQPWVVVARVSAREQVRSKPVQLSAKKPEANVDLGREKFAKLAILFLDEQGGQVPGALYRLEGAHADFPLTKPTVQGPRGGLLFGEIPPGTYTLIAEQRDGPSHRKGVTLKSAEKKEVTLRTVIGLTLSGVVKGPDGEPVAGARLTWVPGIRDDPRVVVTADQGGTFFMRGVRGRAFEFWVDPPPTYAARSRYVRREVGPVAAGQKKLEVRLERLPVIEGTLFGPRPIERVRIQVITKRFRKTHWRTLGKDAAFTLEGLPESKGVIVFRAKDFAPTWVRYGSREDADVKLARVWMDDARTVPVTVRDGAAPLAGARIRPADPLLEIVWRTDAKGEAELSGLPTSSTSVIVESEWHTGNVFDVQPTLSGKRNHLDLEGVRGVVEGFVTPPGGTRQHGVVFKPVGRKTKKGGPPWVQPDARGWYSIKLEPGRYRVSHVIQRRWNPVRLGTVTVKARERVLLRGR